MKSEKLVADAGDSSGTVGSRYQATASEDRRFYVCCSYSDLGVCLSETVVVIFVVTFF
jgi:hypothetical protein